MDPCQAYIICTSPRSGSTLLCRLLAATGVAGNPNSHFHRPDIESWLRSYELARGDFASERDAVAAVFREAIAFGKGQTDMFGLRLQRGSFGFFMEQTARLYPGRANDPARFEAAFGRTRLIWLSRESKLDQAISYIKAQQTGLWHKAPDGTEIERQSAPEPPVYDQARIADQIAKFEAMDRAWQDWFARENLRPIRLSYEALAASPHEALRDVLRGLGVEEDKGSDVAIPVAKLADGVSRDWAVRFRDENGIS